MQETSQDLDCYLKPDFILGMSTMTVNSTFRLTGVNLAPLEVAKVRVRQTVQLRDRDVPSCKR